MQLHAASLGEAVPRENFAARIHSVFASAINLRLAHEDRLITVLISDHYELPQGIRIATKALSLQSLTVNLRAAARGVILRFDSSPLTVDLRGAPVWKCHVPELGMDIQSPAAQRGWTTAWDALNKGQRLKNTDIIAKDLFQAHVDSPLSQRMSRFAMQLIASAAQFDVEGSIHAAGKMIGLGPGVTPSGDDILVGFLTGLWSTAGQNQTRLSFIRAFGNSLMQIAKQTNEISRTYLYHATHGQFSSSLSTLAESIATGGPVEKTMEASMQVGHSSGMDSVTGLLIGLFVWNQDPPSPAGKEAGVRGIEVIGQLRKE